MQTSSDVPAGVYAVAAFHGEKLLGEVETNLLGVPRFGPPGFGDAASTMPAGPANFAITLRYPFRRAAPVIIVIKRSVL